MFPESTVLTALNIKIHYGTYALAKLLWPSSASCYGLNKDAKVLCKYSEAIDRFEIATLKKVYETEIQDYSSQSAILLKQALDAYDEKL